MHAGVMKHVAIVTVYVGFRSVDHDRGYARGCDEARRGGGAGVHDSSRLENQGVLYRDRALGLRAEQGAARRS